MHVGRAYQVNVVDAKHVEAMTDPVVRDYDGRVDIFVAQSCIPWTKGPMLDTGADQ